MHLINTENLRLECFLGVSPPYAILSHTWGPEEVTFADFQSQDENRRERKAGFKKIGLTCEQAKKDGYRYAWVDTCCINKESTTELSEAINSMFKWYCNASICYAFLEDFLQSETTADLSLLGNCKWFSRGWTLQELLAPKEIVFYGEQWAEIGRKSTLQEILREITGIPDAILRKQEPLENISVAARMSWAARRQTTREEDTAYCLMGIFDVNMDMRYGEGTKAFLRLQKKIVKQTQDDSLFAWCSSEASAAEAPYRGLFASSPREFIGCASIIKFNVNEPGFEGGTTMLGNGRVSLCCAVHSCDDNKALLGLKCFRGDLSSILGIEGIRMNGNVYLRSNPSQLIPCSFTSFQNVIVEHHAVRTEAHPADDIYRRDGVYLGDMPQGIRLKATHSEVTESSTERLIPVVKAIGRKNAFELDVDKDVSGDSTPFVGLGKNTQLLLYFWVDQISDSRSYRYQFDIKKKVNEDSAVDFNQMSRSKETHTKSELSTGWIVIHVTGSNKKVEGHDMFYFDIRLVVDAELRATMLAKSESIRRRKEEDEAILRREVEEASRQAEEVSRQAKKAAIIRRRCKITTLILGLMFGAVVLFAIMRYGLAVSALLGIIGAIVMLFMINMIGLLPAILEKI